ncbi:hypothetical protein F8M41_013809 [Gigaspora margarita]|uniref:Uncharacterized protein n=1 Tax=Gigaspora margarita TaxID=4874 RepID=A0A8H3WWN1_GIGMA|nr:hypothetical protein F8M41_013809 [Gigaspora margarita]
MFIENNVEKFLLEAPLEAIIPTMVIFQTVQGQRLKPYEELEPAIRRGINASIAKLSGLQQGWSFGHWSFGSFAIVLNTKCSKPKQKK